MTIRHIQFHPNIVMNLRYSQKNVPALMALDDDQLYWVYDSFSLSDDYPNEDLLVEWIETGLHYAESRLKVQTEEAAMTAWKKRMGIK